jgi:S1-C subfamily serine protease
MGPLRLSRETCVQVSSASFNTKGSGFFVSDRHVVTCFHMIAQVSLEKGLRHFSIAGDIEVTVEDSEPIAATCISIPSRDDKTPLDHDFAVLELARMPTVPHPSLPLAPKEYRPVIGERVSFSGYPLATPCMVSHRGMISGWDRMREIYTIQAAINRGNSGGALISEEGAVIGIISMREGGIAKGLAEVTDYLESAPGPGPAGPRAESLRAVRSLIRALDAYISSGIGYARTVRHLREYLDRHPLPTPDESNRNGP